MMLRLLFICVVLAIGVSSARADAIDRRGSGAGR
jgi:hypothetical protein